MASPFVPFDTQYSNHIHLALHPTTGVVYITVAFHPNNTGPYNCKIWTLAPPYTGQPVVFRDWVAGVYSDGPFGYGASLPLPNGALLTGVPVTLDGQVRPSLYVDPNVAPPFALGGGGTPGPKGDKGDKGDQGEQGDPGSGGLSTEDRAALDWLIAYRAVLHGA